MAVVRKMTMGSSIPTYEFWGKKYNSDALRRKAFEGKDAFKNGLLNGDKYSREIDDVLTKMINGIASGDIVFNKETGRFDDSKYGIVNGPDPKKDYVRWTAQYIYDLMGANEDLYEDPAEAKKIKFDSSDPRKAIDKIIYGAFNLDSRPDDEWIKAYIDMDSPDPESKKRGFKGRGLYIYDRLNPRASKEWWDANVSGFTDDDYNKWAPLITKAAKALNDETGLDPGDLFALRDLSSNMPWRLMLYTGEGYSEAADLLRAAAALAAELKYMEEHPEIKKLQELLAFLDEFDLFMADSPVYTGDLGDSISIATNKVYGDNTERLAKESLKAYSDDLLIDLFVKSMRLDNWSLGHEASIRNYFSSNGLPIDREAFDTKYSVSAVLNEMRTRGNILTPISDNFSSVYYVPGIGEDSNTGIVWSAGGKTLQLMRLHDLPFWLKKKVKEFLSKKESDASGISGVKGTWNWLTTYAKKGGVLKAKGGSLLDVIFYTDEDLLNRIQNQYENKKWSYPSRGKNGAKDTIAPGNGLYNVEPGGSELEAMPYYQLWLYILRKGDERAKRLAEAWARQYKDLNKINSNHYGAWFNGDDFDYDAFINTKTSQNGTKYVYEDLLNGIGHDIIRGRAYQIVDENGNIDENYKDKYFDDLKDDEGNQYELVEGKSDSTNPLATIYYMKRRTDPASTGTPPGAGNPGATGPDLGAVTPADGVVTPADGVTPAGSVSPGSTDDGSDDGDKGKTDFEKGEGEGEKKSNKPNLWDKYKSILNGISPELSRLGRLNMSLETNAKNANIKKNAVNGVYEDTNEELSPVTGKPGDIYGAMNMLANQESEAYRQATTDADRNSARWLEFHSKAAPYLEKAWRADEEEIKRTMQEALRRLEGNRSRWTQVGNRNRKESLRIIEEQANIDVAKNEHDWRGKDNYLKELLYDLMLKKREREALVKSALDNIYTSDYRKALLRLDDIFEEQKGTTAEKTENAKYVETLQLLRSQYVRELFEANEGFSFLLDPYASIPKSSYDDILKNIKFRYGGTLIPKSKKRFLL